MGPGFSPLDEVLELLSGVAFTPWLVESIVRLGALIPFGQVPALLRHFTGVSVSVATVRRLTETAGAVQEAGETRAVDELEHALPDAPQGPPVQLLSVDGAMVPLVGGSWAEVKTLAIGTVEAVTPAMGTTTGERPAAPMVQTRELSYFSRLADTDTFTRLATIETQRRGTETARTVVAVTDGARWCQGFIDVQRADAIRILDFAHALEHLGQVAQAVYGAGTATASAWLGQQAHALRHGQTLAVLDRLAALAAAPRCGSEVRTLIQQTHVYLATRMEQVRYDVFVAAGYPIGSGCVESANKLLVEARLKGSGMHWARDNVNPMLALRALACNQRWQEAWPTLWQAWRRAVHDRARQRRQARRARDQEPPSVVVATPPSAVVVEQPARPKTIVNGKPTKDHPWRRSAPFPAKR